MNYPQVPVSVGELIDKITILQIKSKYSDNEYIKKELTHLTEIAKELDVLNASYIIQLTEVNQTLWDIEDEIRLLEKDQSFGVRFIELARMIYKNNDLRADIKRKINEETNSSYKEIKIFS
jgi:hypothetical protein